MSPTRAVWQISGGTMGRSYADVFLQHGVGLLGPGDPGPWSTERYAYDWALTGFLKSFAEEVRSDDIFLLRTGPATIRAVGIVASDYHYLHVFDDVCGWDLQHMRRVRWLELPAEYTFATPVFRAAPSRFSRVKQPGVLAYVDQILGSPPNWWQEAPLPKLPDEEAPLGEVPSEVSQVVAEAQDLMPLMQDGIRFGDYPSEDEILAHLVVPFFRALGWRPELIAVKWRRVDVALFRCLPRSPGNCCCVIEVKRLAAGVEGAFKQAKGYVDTLQIEGDIVVTDGVRYRLYDPATGYTGVAYANLAKLKCSATKLFDRLRAA